MSKLTPEQEAAVQENINNAIHELVFAAHHISDDDLDRALDILVTVQMSLDGVAENLVEASS